MEGQPLLEFKKVRKARTAIERSVLIQLSGTRLKGDFLSDPMTLDGARIFCEGVVSELQAKTDWSTSRSNELRVITDDSYSSVYVVRIGTGTGKQEKLFGYEKIVDQPVEQPRYSDPELKEFKVIIATKKAAAEAELKYLQSVATQKSKGIKVEGFLESDNDKMQEIVERQKKYIQDLEDALARIKNKTFGICSETGKLIDKVRLQACPHITVSIDAKLELLKIPRHKQNQKSSSKTKPVTMNELNFIPLSSITMIRNYRDVEPPSEKDADVKELAESISKHGVMQAVLLRPNKKPGHYELIFGHRRYMACKVAGLDKIPASIREVADDDILELQVTENLQRKDVHPMDEAVAFKSLMEKKKITVDEISARFAKSKEYIAVRLKLNDLIPELQKDFKSGKMLMGHALQFCRLTESDQKHAKKDHSWGNEKYSTVDRLKRYINENILRDLSSAPFKRDDIELNPAAGACTSCPKRSGANKSLFPDIDKDDRCFDGACFDLKIGAFTARKAKDILEADPSTYLVCDNLKKVSPAITAMAKEMGVKILVDDNDCNDMHWPGSEFNKKAKGFFIDGYDVGKTKTIYLKGGTKSSTATKEKEKSGRLSSSDIAEEIKRIQDREKRSKQIDVNRIHASIEEQVGKNKSRILAVKPQPIDRGIMIYILLTEVGYNPDWRNETMGYVFEKMRDLAKWPEQKLSELIRNIVFKRMMHAGSDQEVRNKHTAIRLMAEYSGIDIAAIEKVQKEIADKRNARIDTRITDLRTKKKELKPSG